jgi:hypothetical protein
MMASMYRVVPLLITLLPALAVAQDFDDLPDSPDEIVVPPAAPPSAPELPRSRGYTFDGVSQKIRNERAYQMEFNFRGRWVTVPKSILDVWYYDIGDENWAYIDRRPRIKGYALGVEFVVKGDSANGIFYAEFMDSEMETGYWDDVEEPPDHLDGDFLAPSAGLGLIAFGADYAYEAHLISPRDTQGRFGLSYLIGGGLGMGIMTGRLDRWGPDEDGNPSYKRYLDGDDPDENKDLPRVYPIVDVNTGIRINLGNRLVWRIEGGLHTLLYYGMSAGVTF